MITCTQENNIIAINKGVDKTLIEPEHMISVYLKEAEFEKGKNLSALFKGNQYIYSMTLNLAGYLTDKLPASSDKYSNLLNQCLDSAYLEWFNSHNGVNDPKRLFAQYMKGLLKPITFLQMIKACNPVNNEEWNPLHIGFNDWLLRSKTYPLIKHSYRQNYWGSLYPVDFRTVIAIKFIIKKPEELKIISGYFDVVVRR